MNGGVRVRAATPKPARRRSEREAVVGWLGAVGPQTNKQTNKQLSIEHEV